MINCPSCLYHRNFRNSNLPISFSFTRQVINIRSNELKILNKVSKTITSRCIRVCVSISIQTLICRIFMRHILSIIIIKDTNFNYKIFHLQRNESIFDIIFIKDTMINNDLTFKINLVSSTKISTEIIDILFFIELFECERNIIIICIQRIIQISNDL